jgi:rod shape-determining protein MreD
MKGGRRIVVAIIALWAAACFQEIAPRLAILGATPDFLLVTMVVLSLHTSRRGGAVLGFFAGFLQGALASSLMGYYVVSRTLAGFFAAWSRDIRFEQSWWLVFLTAFFATAFALAIRLFLPPAQAISPFALATILTATYNGVLAMPLYALLNRLLAPVRL